MTDFSGVPVGAVDFFAELELNNSRQWWTAHAEEHARFVKGPMTALGRALAGEFGTPKVFRPFRDVRFSPDKSPYKTHQGVVVETGQSMGYYVQVSANGLMVAGGWYAGSPEQIARYRAAVSGDTSQRPVGPGPRDASVDPGAELGAILATLAHDGYEIGGDVLASRPRGVPSDHPRLDLLRHRSLTAAVDYGLPEWLDTSELVDRVRADWRRLRPLLTWLADWVG